MDGYMTKSAPMTHFCRLVNRRITFPLDELIGMIRDKVNFLIRQAITNSFIVYRESLL
jgi:hypothetical protein